MKALPGYCSSLATFGLATAVFVMGCAPPDEEIDPNASVVLEDGSLAVDPQDDVVYVSRQGTEGGASFLALFTLDNKSGSITFFADLSKLASPRLVVLDTGVLLADARGDIVTYDRSGNVVAQGKLDADELFADLYASPSRKFALGKHAAAGKYTFVEPATGAVHLLAPTAGKLGHVLWGRKRDAIFATYFDDSDPAGPTAHFLGWDADDLMTSGFAVDENGLWTGPFVDVTLPATATTYGDFDALALSPSDDLAAFPAVFGPQPDMMGEGIVLVDVTTEDVQTFPSHFGPPGFSQDGKWLVTVVPAWEQEWSMNLVNVLDGVSTVLGICDRDRGYFVSHLGDDLLYTYEHGGLVHVDFTTQMAVGPPGDTSNQRYSFGYALRIPARPFIYGIDYGIKENEGVFSKASFETGALTDVTLKFKPQSAAALPTQALIAVSDQNGPLIRLLDPDTGATEAEYTIDIQ